MASHLQASRSQQRPAVLLGFLTAIIAPSAATGATTVTPSLELRAGYNSNLRLAIIDEVDTAYSRVDAGVNVTRDRPTSQLAADFRWRNLQHDRAEFADTDDFFIDAGATRAFETWSVGVNASAARENTLTTAFEDTGFVDIGVQRERIRVTPTLSWARSETVTYSAVVGDEDVSYEDSPNFVDYDYRQYTLSRNQSLSETLDWFVALSLDEFATDDGFNESATTTLRLGVSHRPSETLSLDASVGRSRVETDQVVSFFGFLFPQSSEDDGWQANVNLRKSWEYTVLTVEVSQSILPTGQGDLSERRVGKISLRNALSERTALRLSAEYFDFDDVSTLSSEEDNREYGRLSLALDVRLNQAWLLTATLSHREQEFDIRDDVARATTGYIGFRYTPRAAR